MDTLDTLLHDLRFAARQLVRNPGFAVVAVLTLALGIGANTAIFSVVDGVLLRPLPYPEADDIVRVFQTSPTGARTQNFSDPNFHDLAEQNRTLLGLAQYSSGLVSVSGGVEPSRVLNSWVSRDFFDVMGIRPLVGRTFLPEEQAEGAPPAVIVSHAYWQRYLDGDPDIAGRTLAFGDRLHQVVGVMPEHFDFPAEASLWTPRELIPITPSRTAHNWSVIGRLAPEVTFEQAASDVSAVARRLRAELGDDTWMSDAELVPLRTEMVGRVRPALVLLLVSAAILLLIACANVVNLLLARSAARERELAVRQALGAGRGRLARQFLTEALVLAALGGAVGVLIAHWSVHLLLGFESGNLPRVNEIRMSWGVLLFALGVSAGTAGALGVMAAWRSGGGRVRGQLAGSQRTQAGSTGSRAIRGGLVVSQVGLTLVLLIGAGLLGRSFHELLSQETGYRTEGALVMSLSLPPATREALPRIVSFHDELIERLRALPGVSEVGGGTSLPLSGGFSDGSFVSLNYPDEVRNFDDFTALTRDPARVHHAQYRVASSGYFRALEIPLLRGRLFDDRDAPDASHTAIISESLARAAWPDEDALGKLIQFGNMDGDLRPFTVVGIVGDVRERRLDAEPQPTFYASYRQRATRIGTFSFVVAGPPDPTAIIPAAREILREMSPETPPSFSTLEEIYSAALADRRFNLLLVATFGGTALLLALMGIYGVMSFTVAQRTREIGVRMALGARSGSVVGLVVTQALVMAAIGVGLGMAASLALTRLMAGLLFGVSTTDLPTFAAVSLLLVGVALLASFVPARRASRVDPMIALRAE